MGDRKLRTAGGADAAAATGAGIHDCDLGVRAHVGRPEGGSLPLDEPQGTERARVHAGATADAASGIDGRRAHILPAARRQVVVHPGGGGGGIGDAFGDGLGTGRGAADEHSVGARLGGPVLGVELGDEPVAVERRTDQPGDLPRLLGGHEPGREHHQVGA